MIEWLFPFDIFKENKLLFLHLIEYSDELLDKSSEIKLLLFSDELPDIQNPQYLLNQQHFPAILRLVTR